MEEKQEVQGDIGNITVGQKILLGISSLLTLAVGIILFFNLGLIVVLFPTGVFAYGLFLIVKYFSMKDERTGWTLLNAIICILFGIMMFFGDAENRILGFIVIEIYVGFWALIAGFTNIFGSVGQKKREGKSGIWTMITGVLLVLCGVGMLLYPLLGLVALAGTTAIFVSLSFVFSGLSGIIVALTGNKALKDMADSCDGNCSCCSSASEATDKE